ncbi:MAG TPA: polysaccharide biosynthesis tyrosine autokinase [Pseudolabrys sp.]
MPAPPRGGEASGYSADLREILRILNRRRWIIITTTVASLGAAAAFLLTATPKYTATSTILIDPRRSSVVESNDNNQSRSSVAPDDGTINSQVSLIQSAAVLRRVVDELDLSDDPEFKPRAGLLNLIIPSFETTQPLAPGQSPEDVAKSATVDFLADHRLAVIRQPATYVIDINVKSESPEKAAKIANAIVDSYFYEQLRNKQDTRKTAASWFDKQIQDLRSRVLASDKAVEDFRAAHNLTLAQGVTINDQQLGDLTNKLIEAQVQTAEARAKFEQVQNIVKTHGDPGAVSQALASGVITQLRAQYAEAAKNLADVSSKFSSRHPLVVNAKAQVREAQKLINDELERVLESTRQDLQVAQSHQEALQKSLDDLTHVSNEAGNDQVRLRELQREADANRTLYASFLARYKEISAQESADLPDSQVVSKADIPIAPSFPKSKLVLAIAVVGGSLLGGMLVFAVELFDRRIKSVQQAEEVTGIPTLAAIPLIGVRGLARRAIRGRRELDRYDPKAVQVLPPAMQPPLMRYSLEEPTSLFAESVRAVRLAVQRAARTETVKTVVVCSSTDGEGKTTLAVNLALSLAAIGTRTLLIEGDLRNPEMSRSLCPRASVGAIEVATGQASLREALLLDRTTGLAILPSPPSQEPSNSSEFVFSDAMSNMLAQLRQHFDHIIVDSPPLFPLVDARALADIADRVVLTIRWDSTPKDVVAQSIQALAPVYDRMLGTVLTRVDMRRLRYYDYYRSSSYLAPYSYLGHPRVERSS